ncbi:bifunctional apoptosis regulator-like isoform X2 [Paramisgurnus dabryanus]|uniref:bifunctional apoptosis regulator-like isoform X2 n=1 Tax=Paramisgurnus dabryanus TaxID=90735 RepID=UPI0031F36DD7
MYYSQQVYSMCVSVWSCALAEDFLFLFNRSKTNLMRSEALKISHNLDVRSTGKMTDECITIESDEEPNELPPPEFTCHCCYEVLVDPTTLNCGHSFCRHCVAQWLHSSRKNECPECRQRWQGFPKVNILLRDAVEKLFPAEVSRRRRVVQRDPQFRFFLKIFQQYGQMLTQNIPLSNGLQQATRNSFFLGVMVTLICMGVFMRYRSNSADSDYDILVQKPISRWNADDVNLWVKHLGPWTNQYSEVFHREQINGSLLAHLRDEELSAAPFRVENPSHRQVMLDEIQKIKELKVKQPQNLWEYKATNLGKSLFLQFGLREFPRITFLYLYLFDYEDTFLPFIHTCCPAHTNNLVQDVPPDNILEPSLRQWVEFRVKVFLMPYLLLVDFAWNWLSVHCWISWIVIVNSIIMTVFELFYIWTLWRRKQLSTLPISLLWQMLHVFLFVLLWPLVPQIYCDLEFYAGLFISSVLCIWGRKHVFQMAQQ